jgi:cell division protease FtsH
VDEAKEEVKEIIEFLRNPNRFQRLGGRVPRGVLLVGAPGTGKTLLAKAIAGEAKVPFFSICGSDFVEMFVGVGASRVRDLFKQAKDNSPCIIFLDEVDAVGRRRGSGLGGGHDEREQTLNAILVEMDGFESDEGIIVMAATNRPDVLDPALLRPGRFDRQIMVDLPDLEGRAQIIRVHTRGVKLSPDVDIQVLARGTPSFSGAEIEAMVNEAAIIAAMRDKESVGMEELEEARDKVRWGRQKQSRVMEETDRRVTAYHEGGHALVAHLLPEVEPLHKVTIIPRGMALGATMQLPERDRYHLQKKTVLGNIMVLYGGRIAEKVACSDISSGAQNDIERATELARAMVCEWGMSDRLGPVSFNENEQTVFLGREITRNRNHSEATAESIDGEIKRILSECYEKTEALIEENRSSLDVIADALLKYETLSGQEVDRLLKGETLDTIKRAAPARKTASDPVVPSGEEEKRLDEGLAGARGSEAVS